MWLGAKPRRRGGLGRSDEERRERETARPPGLSSVGDILEVRNVSGERTKHWVSHRWSRWDPGSSMLYWYCVAADAIVHRLNVLHGLHEELNALQGLQRSFEAARDHVGTLILSSSSGCRLDGHSSVWWCCLCRGPQDERGKSFLTAGSSRMTWRVHLRFRPIA